MDEQAAQDAAMDAMQVQDVPVADIDITRADSWPEFLTPQQVSAVLQISEPSVRSLCDSGEIPSISYGPRTLRIPKAGLIARKEAQTTAQAPEDSDSAL